MEIVVGYPLGSAAEMLVRMITKLIIIVLCLKL